MVWIFIRIARSLQLTKVIDIEFIYQGTPGPPLQDLTVKLKQRLSSGGFAFTWEPSGHIKSIVISRDAASLTILQLEFFLLIASRRINIKAKFN